MIIFTIVIIILIIIVIILNIRLQKMEKFLKIENYETTDEAVQAIASIYADKDKTMVVNNLQVTGKIMGNLAVNGQITSGGQQVLRYNDNANLEHVGGDNYTQMTKKSKNKKVFADWPNKTSAGRPRLTLWNGVGSSFKFIQPPW